jgi:hypothetical protein
MKNIIFALSLMSGLAHAACTEIPAFAQIKKVQTPFSTLTGNFEMEISLEGMTTLNCELGRDGSMKLQDAALVRVRSLKGNVVQEYITTAVIHPGSSSISFMQPTRFIQSGMILTLGLKNTLQMSNAVFPVTVQR